MYKKAKSLYLKIFSDTENLISFKYVFLFIAGYILLQLKSAYQHKVRYEQISAQEYVTVEGKVDDYKVEVANSRSESFTVNGVNFQYNNFATPKGFFMNSNYPDSPITQDQSVRISYLRSNGQNFILKLEIRE